jgi:hypothetical protein
VTASRSASFDVRVFTAGAARSVRVFTASTAPSVCVLATRAARSVCVFTTRATFAVVLERFETEADAARELRAAFGLVSRMSDVVALLGASRACICRMAERA